MSQAKRRYPIGAELIGENETHFRVWAPKARKLDVVLEDAAEVKPKFCSLTAESNGYFSGPAGAGPGTRYRFRVNGAENFYPDPASRFQPDGPHGSSCIVDPTKFRWSDAQWPGLKIKGQIIYEMHLGTFTKEGTWRAAAEQLSELARIGITVIEMMPVAEFPGRFGWGYDGVNLFAPSHLYGTPDDLRAFVDRAHWLGLGVILDVVYNHFGPDGNYLGVFSDDYLIRGKGHEWGDVVNFDGPNSGPVREFFITNGRYWIEEFHFDGFRFDATHAIRDQSEEYIIGALGHAAREAAGPRSIILIAENDLQESKMTQPRNAGGDDQDGMWNDDFHHSAIVALTGNNVGYYSDYSGHDCTPFAGTVDAVAVSRTGIRHVQSFSILRRCRRCICARRDLQRSGSIARAVPITLGRANIAKLTCAGCSRGFLQMQARFRRARKESTALRPAHRPS